ncbi:putative mitochondrial hypothetical protein [Leptomonas pyrrhocoris]|uniref:Uncharacterized protein n=1 Tax=Leptomonas pyrrhocoris TaxID=157538 RepID=A0A0M9GAX7_LEPPY|nr:putative mitochondrial hypothetical protein [Leptomonas pyrrhocoris]KPA86590.1 putative mitochondrial hypothetical protein [Leptomonas pyrrhocoris]|eukprot:XP_015665029.1 putative mitochondrial hypothetical protein [Leptomonas pyrrhocoris]
MSAIMAIVYGINPLYVVASAVAQQVLAMAWYGCIVRHIDRYYLAADKGVRRFEHVVQRYSGFMVSATNFLCSVLRTIILLALVSVFHFQTLTEYQTAAMVTVALGMPRVSRLFSCQRPIQLFITETGYEVAAAMTAAVISYSMKAYKF